MTDCTATLKNELTGPEPLRCAFQAGHVHPENGTDHAGPDVGPAGRTWWSDNAVGATPHSTPMKTRPGDQPLPSGGREPVQDALIADIRARRDLGVQRYGSPLMTHNGRDAVQDALEEAVDLAVYLKQVAMETRDREQELAVLRAEVAAARKFAGEMRDFCSPHGVSVDYADRLVEAMELARKEASR